MKHSTHIAAQGLGPALEALAKEHTFQVLYRTEVVKGLRAHSVDGDLTTEQALQKLLGGTGLSYRYLGHRAITIVPTGFGGDSAESLADSQSAKSGSSAQRRSAGGGGAASGPFRMAQMDRGASASAATSGAAQLDKPVNLDEVIVTAQKYSQRAFDVPMSLEVISGAELQQRDISGLAAMQFDVPGLYVQSTGVQTRIEIRGVSNIFGAGALVGEYLDEADATASPDPGAFGVLDLRSYDLERVEVLRGPQGTLYGQGSIGGTIRLITRKPDLDSAEIMADAATLFTQDGAPSQHIEAAVNAPLVAQMLGLRVAAEFSHEGGWMDQPAAQARDINQSNLTDVRIQGLWRPSSQVSVTAMQIIHRNTFGPNEGEDANGDFTQSFHLTMTPSASDNYDLSNLTIRSNMSTFELLSSTTYFDHENETRNEAGRFQATPGPDPLVLDEYIPASSAHARDVGEELRLTRTAAGPWRWTTGGYFKRFQETFPSDLTYFAVAGPPGSPLPTPFPTAAQTYLSKSWAAFMDSSYQLYHRLTLGAGVRYFRDNQSQDSSGVLQTGAFSSTDPRVYLQYQVTSEVNTYLSAAKGFRSGGFNARDQPAYSPETVWTYEIGAKTRLLDGRLSIDADVFYSDYKNYVTVGYDFTNPVDIFRNGGRVHIKGVETGVAWQPLGGWTLSANGDYINGRFVQVPPLGADYQAGDPVDMSPRFSLTASIRKDFQAAGKPLFSRLDYSERAPLSYRLRSLGSYYYSESDYVYLLDFLMGIQWSDNLQLELLAKNLLNDRGRIDNDSLEGLSARSRPRTLGAQFTMQLE